MRHKDRRVGRGITLVECLVGLAVLAIVLSAGLPAYTGWRESTRLRGAADRLHNDLRLAQSEAHRRLSNVAVSFRRTADGGWCYGWRLETACDCEQLQHCVIDGTERAVRSDDWPGIDLAPGIAGNTLIFNPRRSTVTAGHITVAGASGDQLRVVVSGIGRIRQCAPGGGLLGLPECE